VAVSCTEARHVSKPRGAKPGTVTIRKERVLKVRPPSEEALAALRPASA
jgi:predicted ribosome quality control (RQC) complex YloA/Tae2 family protein